MKKNASELSAKPRPAKRSKSAEYRAVIDVGTNSVKLLVADVSGKDISPILEESEQTRLGRGFYDNHMLQKEAILLTANAVAHFTAKAKEAGADAPRLIATSAARDAKNAKELVEALEKSSGTRLEIISGEQEAEWAFQGVSSDPALAKSALLILDVGGGSTEFIVGDKGHLQFRESFQLGTVRFLEQLPHSDPPRPEELDNARSWMNHFLLERAAPKLQPALKGLKNIKLVGTGGTSTILARIANKMTSFDRDEIEAARLPLKQVKKQCNELWSLSLADRKQIVGLPAKRADVILYGAVIFEAIMETFGFSELRVSTRGLRYAALMK